MGIQNSYRLGRRPGEWLRERGPEGDIAISTRIRLARNVEGYPFSAKLPPRKANELSIHLRKKLRQAFRPQPNTYLNMGEADPVTRRLLVERHLISREHARKDRTHGVVIGPGEISSVMINEEDHLRMQILRSGWRPEESFQEALELDEKISSLVPYAESPDFGYLTSCPTNAGTGLRISAMLHLPALVILDEIESRIEEWESQGLEIRGLYGEGSRAHGDLFQVSNRVTLGKTEMQILKGISRRISAVMESERRARKTLITESKDVVENHIADAIARCTTSSTVRTQDSMKALSLLRLAIHLGLYQNLPIDRINELFLWTQPGHLQYLVGRGLRRIERDSMRAQLVRRWCSRHLPPSA